MFFCQMLNWFIFAMPLWHSQSAIWVFAYGCSVTNDGKFIDNEFDDVYLVTTLDPIPLEAFTLQV